MDTASFQAPSKIYIEPDSTHKIGPVVKLIGQRIFLLTLQSEFKNSDEFAILRTSMEKHSQGCIIYDNIVETPDAEEIDTAAHFIKRSQCDVIVAYGSWETFSLAKVIAILAKNEMFAEDLIKKEKTPKYPPLPIVTIPNRPSMGEEISPHFTAMDTDNGYRVFFHDIRLFPSIVYLDPKILLGLSGDEIVRGGVSIIAASIETILNKRSNELTNTLALRSLELIAKHLPQTYKDPTNISNLSNITTASVLSGMAYSTSYLGLCYAISLSLSQLNQIDISVAMGLVLPHMMEFYLTSSPAKYVQIAKALEEDISDISVIEAAIKAVEGVRKLYLEINFPQRLSDFSISKADLPQIAAMASQYGFLKFAPRALNRNEIETILIAAY